MISWLALPGVGEMLPHKAHEAVRIYISGANAI
jgi:hypothetical protein